MRNERNEIVEDSLTMFLVDLFCNSNCELYEECEKTGSVCLPLEFLRRSIKTVDDLIKLLDRNYGLIVEED